MSSYTNYEWSAFTEADLLAAGSNNGTSIGRFDKFVMPAAATVTMSTSDNDVRLHGDTRVNDQSNDQTGQLATINGERAGSQMYAEVKYTLKGSDGKTYTLIEIEVEDHDAPGTGDDYFTFFGAVPPAGVELSVVDVANVSAVRYSSLGAGEVDPNTAPEFTNRPDDGKFMIDENTTEVFDFDATDADGDAVTFSIEGGVDAEFFNIDPDTGVLSFIVAPDFEAPQDHGGNNIYDVRVKVTDSNGNETWKGHWVQVNDVDEDECVEVLGDNLIVNGDFENNGVNIGTKGWKLVDEINGWTATEDRIELQNKDFKTGNTAGNTVVELDGNLNATIEQNVEITEAGTYRFSLDYAMRGDNADTNGFEVYVDGVLQATVNPTDSGFQELTFDLNLAAGSSNIEIKGIGDADCIGTVIDNVSLQQVTLETCDCEILETFNVAKAGDIASNQFAGFTVFAQRKGDGGTENDAMIFDTANPTGGDNDLGFADQGMAIIISEDNDSSDPDDNAGGGFIVFDFDEPSELKEITLLDIEGTGSWVRLIDADGNIIKQIDVIGTGDNTAQVIDLDAEGVARMTIKLHTSGAVDDLCFNPGVAPELGSLSGTYFADADRDGLDNDGANGIEGITVELLDENGNPTGATTTTDADGNYSFGDLEAGTYGVKFTDPDTGRELTTQDVDGNASDDIDSDASDVGGGMSTITGITVVAGENTPDNDAGVVDLLGSLSGRYFFDTDRDGLDNDADNAVTGVTVELLDENGNGTGITTTTDADGNYSFGDLEAGTYGVKFTDTVTGQTLTTQNVDGNASDDIDSDAADIGGGMSTINGITVVAGENTPDNDAGVVDLLGSIGGTYFCDENDNDVQDAGDVGLEGQTVWLVQPGSGVVAQTTTDADGNYLFEDLPAGDYYVRFDGNNVGDKTLVESNVGNDDTIDSDIEFTGSSGNHNTGVISLGAGEDVRDVDAGVELELGSLSGTYFADADRDGLDNDGANGIAGITVELLDENGNPTGAVTTTDADGNYSFGDLEAGTYGVKFTDPDTGRELTTQDVDGNASDDIDSDASDVGGGMSTITGITVVAGENTPDNDAGVVDLLGSLSGRYFCDENDNDVDDGEPGIAGATVTLLDENGNPVLDGGGNAVTTTTDANGNYTFTGLAAGTYGVVFAADAEGKTFVDQNDPIGNGDDTNDSDANDSGVITGITVVGGQDTPNNDAGVEDPGNASVGDFVWFDANGDGLQGADEAGVSGVSVTLTGAGDDGVIGTTDDTSETTITDADGGYLFDGLDAGSYKITFDKTTTGGLIFTALGAAAADAAGNDSDANEVTGMTSVFDLDIGEAERGIDAGLVDPKLGALGDKVFIDTNGNGQQDAGEVGVDGVDVTLFDEDGNVLETTETTNGGMYLFDGLAAGDYTVGFAEVDTFDFTTADQGDDASDSDANQVTGLTDTITLGVGEVDLTVDAGLVKENGAPEPQDDTAMTCADEVVTVDVLDNDADPDGDALAITAVDGQAIVDGGASITTAAGTVVSLVGGQLVIDGEAAYAALDIGESAVENISYTVSDGEDTSDANVAVTFKGDANTLDSFFGSFPADGTYELEYALDEGAPFPEYAFDLRFLDTGDARLDGMLFEQAYCLDFSTAVRTLADNGIDNTGALFGAQSADALNVFDPNTVSNANGLSGSENLDLINWVIAQDFEDQGYSGWEVQIAIWELADDFDSSETNFAAFDDTDFAGVQEILSGALALDGASDVGVESYLPVTEGTVGLIVDPGQTDIDNVQPFIVAIDFETFDCIC